MKNSRSNFGNTDKKSVIKATCNFIVPFTLDRFVIIPIWMYWTFSGVCLLITVLLLLMHNNPHIKGKRPGYMALSITIAVFLCSLACNNANKKQDAERISMTLNTTFSDYYEYSDNNGNVENMLLVGGYYSFLKNQQCLQAPPNDIRDDELIDTRDFKKANRYLEMAASHNCADAYVLLGEMKMQGLGCVPSSVLAIEYFKKANEIDSSNKLLSEALSMHHLTKDVLLSDFKVPQK